MRLISLNCRCKSTVMFIIINARRNYPFLKPLRLERKRRQRSNVDFSLHTVLIHIGVVSQRLRIMHKGVILTYLIGLFIGLSSEISRQAYLGQYWYEFCTIY